MRAGRLDRTIEIAAYTAGDPDEYGNSTEGFYPVGTYRAAVITMSTEEFLRSSGEASEGVIVFQTRYIPNLSTTHRVTYDGRPYDVKEVKEIGRRKGLEIRCEEHRS